MFILEAVTKLGMMVVERSMIKGLVDDWALKVAVVAVGLILAYLTIKAFFGWWNRHQYVLVPMSLATIAGLVYLNYIN